jgi:hypothetical protein
MKKFIAAGLMLASLNSFSQSYLVLNNGITLTTDKAGFIYDFSHFNLPYKITTTGSNFFVGDLKLKTVDANGFLYEKGIKGDKLDEIKLKGGNFFINEDNNLYTIDSKGFFYTYEDDSKIFKKIIAVGGNYFLAQTDKKKPAELYTVNDKGNYFKVAVDGLNTADIAVTSGKFFQTKAGVTFTVSKDGFVYNKSDIKTGTIAKSGGNYFIDSAGLLFTVSDEGLLILPVLPANIKIAELKSFGADYMVDGEGRLFTVDAAGNLNERTINHDLRNSKIFSASKK